MAPIPDRRALCSGLVAPRPDAALRDAQTAEAKTAGAQTARAQTAEAQTRAPRRCPIRAHCLWYTLPPRDAADKPLPGPYDPTERACPAFEPG